MIPVNLDLLIHPDAAARLRSAGLHKVAAALAKQEGFKIGEDISMKNVVTIIGTKLRQKNAEWARVHEGLQSLRRVG